jgi:hypothetical protein
MTHRTPVVDISSRSATFPATTTRAIETVFDFTRAVLADPTLLDHVPDGVTLVLLPDHDAELMREQIEAGLTAIREGRDVLFRHVRRTE